MAVTLAVVGSLTWVVAANFGSSTGVGSAQGLPADDPCAAIGDEPLERINGEVRSWGTSTYSNSCSWEVSLKGEDEVLLNFNRSVPMSEADFALVEERGQDTADTARTPEELYSSSVEDASEVGVEGVNIVNTQERSLTFGDESVLVLTDIAYGTEDSYTDEGSHTQRVSLIVREGALVSRIVFNLSRDTDTIDLVEAEELLEDMAANAFG